MKCDHFYRVLVAGLLSSALFAIGSRFLNVGGLEVTVWGDRDLWRALEIPAHFPVFGPETNSGARTPGGGLYYLIRGFLWFDSTIRGAQLGVLFLYLASAMVIVVGMWRLASPLAAAMATVAFAGSGMLLQSLGVWNPGYVVFFATAGLLATFRALSGGTVAWLLAAGVLVGLGLQIHLQMAQLGLGLLVAWLVYRRAAALSGVACLLVGVAVTYLPAIWGNGGFDFISTMLYTTQDGISTYAGINPFTAGKLSLLYAIWSDAANVVGNAFAGRYGAVLWMLRAAELLFVGLGVAFLLGFRQGKVAAEAPFGFFAVVALVYLSISLFSSVNFRHMVAMIPVAAIIVGLGGEAVATRVLRRQTLLRSVVVVGVCGLLALPALVLGALCYTRTSFFPTSAFAQEEITKSLKPSFFADHEAFEAHVALVDKNGRLIIGNIYNRMAFIYATTVVPSVKSNASTCVVVLERGSDLAGVLASPPFSAINARNGRLVAESQHFLYATYDGAEGNCLKSFSNAYIPTAFESTYLPDNAPASGRDVDNGVVFVLPQARSRFPIAIAISQGNEGVRAKVHGRLLRGHTGLWTLSLGNAMLCFAAEGQTVRLPLAPAGVAIGDISTATLAPWTSTAAVLAAGEYSVWFLADRDDGSTVTASLGRVRMAADGTLRVIEGGALNTCR